MPPDDGTVEVPLDSSHEETKMDLPASFGVLLMSESGSNVQADNREGRALTLLAAGVLKGAMARNFDELGTIESRANSGIIATPVASPAVQSGTTP